MTDMLNVEAGNIGMLAEVGAGSGSLPAKELLRRSRILAARAESVRRQGLGRDDAVCRFCGKAKRRGALAEHLRRRHAAEISAKPATWFD